MKLRLEGDFTKLKLNGLSLVEHLARVPGHDNIVEVDFDTNTRAISSFKVDGVEMLGEFMGGLRVTEFTEELKVKEIE